MFQRPSRDSFTAREITHRNIVATVKWFNPSKGFGFVKPEDGSPDAFLHGTVLRHAGHDGLADGTTITCDLSMGPKGPQVAQIHNVDESTAMPSGGGARRPMGGGGGRDFGGPRGGGADAFAEREVIDGRVKFFNAARGFGFISPLSGGKDVFVHSRTLQRSGIESLGDGDQVRVTVRQGVKGPEAEGVELL